MSRFQSEAAQATRSRNSAHFSKLRGPRRAGRESTSENEFAVTKKTFQKHQKLTHSVYTLFNLAPVTLALPVSYGSDPSAAANHQRPSNSTCSTSKSGSSRALRAVTLESERLLLLSLFLTRMRVCVCAQHLYPATATSLLNNHASLETWACTKT